MSSELGGTETLTGQRFYYLFKAAGHRLAVPLDCVERLVRAVEITPLPNAGKGTAGMINVQGQAVPVLDLHHWLGANATEETKRRRTQPRLVDHFILLSRKNGLVALWADKVEGVIHHGTSGVVKSDGVRWNDGKNEGDWQFLKTEQGLIPICDVESLLSMAPDEVQSYLTNTEEVAQ